MSISKQEVEDIAFAVADNLRTQHLIPGEISSEVGAWIRELNHERDWMTTFIITMGTYNTPIFDVTMLASGAIRIELCDMNGAPFWRGTLMPVDRPHEGT